MNHTVCAHTALVPLGLGFSTDIYTKDGTNSSATHAEYFRWCVRCCQECHQEHQGLVLIMNISRNQTLFMNIFYYLSSCMHFVVQKIFIKQEVVFTISSNVLAVWSHLTYIFIIMMIPMKKRARDPDRLAVTVVLPQIYSWAYLG